MNLEAEMRALEEALLHNDHRAAPLALERMLAPAFTEVSASGRTSDRAAVLEWLLHKDPAARWELEDLEVAEPVPGLRVVRYLAQQVAPQRSTGNGAWHCSLWCYEQSTGCWQLQYHQATRRP